jgi:hypothetical protein
MRPMLRSNRPPDSLPLAGASEAGGESASDDSPDFGPDFPMSIVVSDDARESPHAPNASNEYPDFGPDIEIDTMECDDSPDFGPPFPINPLNDEQLPDFGPPFPVDQLVDEELPDFGPDFEYDVNIGVNHIGVDGSYPQVERSRMCHNQIVRSLTLNCYIASPTGATETVVTYRRQTACTSHPPNPRCR